MLSASNDWRREYDNQRYQERRAKILKILGNQCSVCESSENLEVDHVDPSTKNFTVGTLWTKRWPIVLDELEKCQLLCKPCHSIKSRFDKTGYYERQHGTFAKYKKDNCRCDECRETWNSYMREYKRRKR